MSAMNFGEIMRLAVACVIAPLASVVYISSILCTESSAYSCIKFFSFAAYSSMVIFGIPALGFIVNSPSFVKCVLWGSATAVLPILLLGAITLFYTARETDLREFVYFWSNIMVSGAVGGCVFWSIAFFRPLEKKHR